MDENQVNALTDRVNVLTAEYRAKYEKGSRAELEALNAEVVKLQLERQAGIAAGCSPCPSCGEQPIGAIQVMVVSREVHDAFEIGCVHCLDHRAKATDLASARALWEKGPSEPAVVDANGATTKRAVRGWITPSDGRTLTKTDKGIVSTLADGKTINWSATMTLVQRGKLARAARAASPMVPKIERAEKTETLAST